MAPTVPTRASILQKEKILPGIRVRGNSIITHKRSKAGNRVGQVTNKWSSQVENEKKMWKAMDGRDCVFIHEEKLWRCVSAKVS